MTDKIVPLYMDTRAKWRNWLAKNFDKVDVVWLALKKKNSVKKGIVYTDAVEEALCFGWIDGHVKSFDEDYFIQRFTPRKARSIWSKINKDRVLKLIADGRMTDAGLIKIEEAKKNGQWQKAYSTATRLEVSSTLIPELKNNPEAWESFCSFAPSHRNMYILWINNAKKEETRKRRIEKVIQWSIEKKKPGML